MTHLVCLLFGHKFGEWEYESERTCVQQRVCDRDGYTERRTAPHAYGEWRDATDGSCEQLAVCERCGHENRRPAHHFEQWQYLSDHSCEQRAVCSRCGHEERRQAPHQYQTDAYQSYPYQQSGLIEAARCARCGAVACSICGGELEPIEMNLDHEPPWGVLRTYKCRACNAELYVHSKEW